MAATASTGTLAARLVADTSEFRAAMTQSATVSEREMKRAANAVKYVNDYLKETGRIQAAAAQDANRNASANAFATMAERQRQSVQGMTISAGQYANAMRMIPAQLTDVATQLAGGQNPLLILLQQGGQVKDSFGGVGNMMRGLGSMITPAGVAMTALGGAAAMVAYEMWRGAKESEEFQRQIALTGNFAAITERKLQDMASAQGAALGRGQLDQGDTISALVGTGRFGPDMINQAAEAMGRYQKLSGATASDALKNFVSMADGAARWAAEQNKSMHFLTGEQYRHIKALEDSGRAQDAMKATLEAFNTSLKDRAAPELGNYAYAWKLLTEQIQAAQRAVMDYGKSGGIAGQMTAAQTALAKAQGDLVRAQMSPDAGGMQGQMRIDAGKAAVAAAQAEVDNQRARLQLEEVANGARSKIAEKEAANIRAQQAQARTRAPAATKRPDQDYIGDAEGRIQSLIAQWRERDMAAQDRNELLPDYIGEAEDRMKARIEAWKAQEADAEQAAKDRLDYGKGVTDASAKWWAEFTNENQRGAALFANTMKGMEDAVVSWAKTGKVSASSFFGSIAEEYLRQQVRMAQSKLLYDSAGNFSLPSIGGMLGSVGGFFGFPHANGLDYVPYDGYPAVLHQGERVQTAAEVRAGGGGGGGGNVMHFDFSGQQLSVGAGVNPGQVAAAVQAGNKQTEARIRRLMSEGKFSS